jgi:uncharacterized protein YbcI
MDAPRDPAEAAADLLSAGSGEAQISEGLGQMRADIARAMVGLKKEYYGRGPTAAKAWILDDYVFVALEGGLYRHEETLLAAGKEDVVRAYRLSFQETMSETTMGAVAHITGREVLSYHSQIVFDPTRSFEIFVLSPS